MKRNPVPLALALATVSVTRTAPIPAHWKSEVKDRWHGNLIGLQERLAEAVEAGDPSAAQRWAIANGIATEKVLLLDGQPTQLVGHLHEHRHELGVLLERLGSVARRVGAIDAIATVIPDGEGGNGQPGHVGHGRGGPALTGRGDK